MPEQSDVEKILYALLSLALIASVGVLVATALAIVYVTKYLTLEQDEPDGPGAAQIATAAGVDASSTDTVTAHTYFLIAASCVIIALLIVAMISIQQENTDLLVVSFIICGAVTCVVLCSGSILYVLRKNLRLELNTIGPRMTQETVTKLQEEFECILKPPGGDGMEHEMQPHHKEKGGGGAGAPPSPPDGAIRKTVVLNVQPDALKNTCQVVFGNFLKTIMESIFGLGVCVAIFELAVFLVYIYMVESE